MGGNCGKIAVLERTECDVRDARERWDSEAGRHECGGINERN